MKPNGIAQELARMASRIAELERRVESAVRMGTVADVDPAKKLTRLQVGVDPDGKPVLSPWRPYAQFAGALKVHTPPTVGQAMTLVSPGGDMEQGMAIPLGWTDANPGPSDKGDENVITFGNVRIEIRGGEVVATLPRLLIDCGASLIEIDGGKLRIVSPQILENE